MKSAIISICLLLAVIIMITTFNIIISRQIDDIIHLADKLPFSVKDKDKIKPIIKKIDTLWKKYRFFASLGVPEGHMENIQKDIINIKSFYKAKQSGGYISSVDLFKIDLHRLQEVYRLSFDNLF